MPGLREAVTPPAVSVVVIVYNDASRLPTAMRSVLDQSLPDVEMVVVDDASTDGSARVARRVAAAYPDRVRVISLQTNSGGCGVPRNVGVAHVRAEHVMFLDSDDTLDPSGCERLLRRADETGADLVAGRCVRVHHDDGGRESVWCPKLFERPAAYDTLRDNPDLLNDTLATNKLYRRDFLQRTGLRFPEGLHYEDILFSARAYLAARRIAITPERVYNWRLFRRSGRRSITASRADLRNFRDRIEVHRRTDAMLTAQGATDLRLHKDVKFINHDLQLYVSDLRMRDARYRKEFTSIAARYLAELDPAALEECKPIHGILAYFLLRGEVDRAIVASDFAGREGRRGRLLTDLVARNGRVYWCDADLDTDLGRAQLDVTDLGLVDVPLTDMDVGNEVTMMDVAGPRLRLGGELVNPLGRIPPEPSLSAELELFDVRHRHRTVRIPATVHHGPRRIRWSADVDLTRRLRPWGIIDPAWGMLLVLHTTAGPVRSRLTADRTYTRAQLPVRARLGPAVGDHIETELTDGSILTLRIVARRPLSRAVVRTARRFIASRHGRRILARVLVIERRLLPKSPLP